jgi:hypothetical protein
VFGQAFFPSYRHLLLRVVRSAICASLLAGCADDPGGLLSSGRMLAWAGPEGRWAGSVSPVDPGCGVATTGLMSIGSAAFAFDPFQSTDVLHGKIGPAGDVTGETARAIPGARPVAIDFLGRIQRSEDGGRIVGTLTSGRCHWLVTLLRG